ncbi:asparagine synthase [Hokovirus HKV1]|uniref:asparagine synthase (glutamine-hydrolyzing) n=1 Tax=Hokovirus HKV1 TaxID=1977638 RepID=A0A1V0SGM7_9VIRU|nr:asparagine synthase [Hokovirus HKV1]
MCGIICIIHYHNKENYDFNLDKFKECTDRLKNRGPDKTNYLVIKKENYDIYFGFTRLAIMDTSINGMQPFTNNNGDYVICNGEIYNYLDLAKKYDINLETSCDCEILLPLLNKLDFTNVVNNLDAEFALIYYNNLENKLFAARDKYGVRPLYYGFSDNLIGFGSELKSLHSVMDYVEQVKPQNIFQIELDKPRNENVHIERYYDINNVKFNVNNDIVLIKQNIRNLLFNAVKKRLIADRPIGFLLSGGLDSSLIVAIASKILGPENITCFSIGIPGSPDIEAAKIVVNYLGIKNHHIIPFLIEEGISILPQVIETIETYDITTIRASTPQYIMAKYIKDNTDIRVILSGEGSDELHGSYRYFYNAPNSIEFNKETKRLLTDLCYFDNLRTDRTMANHGLEVRVPFLDFDYVNYILSIDQNLLMFNDKNMEKKIIRDSFIKLLPEEILYRRKEAFSDAVSNTENNWINSIKIQASKKITMEKLLNNTYIMNKPKTVDALYFRQIFDSIYPNRDNVNPYYWLPKWQKTDVQDPSATILNCY